ncbi:MAG: BlaI/MecI/CopY family transcriptional regulator [Muribaculaceae bacterium]|nr:BlaI/MecI/CopY family transcriptional regulator [Muribaculaceae bacterium]
MKKLTEREEELMEILWNKGPMFVREIIEELPEPKTHFNTISTFVRLLENKGFVSHTKFGSSYRYEAAVSRDEFSRSTLKDVVDRYFGSSLKASVSALFHEENLSDDELRSIIETVINHRKENKAE